MYSGGYVQLETFQYLNNKWSTSKFLDLDSPNTLVLVFCAPEYARQQTPLTELAKMYPTSNIIGCSSAGEIFGSNVHDNSVSVAVIKFDKTEVKITSVKNDDNKKSFAAGEYIAKELNAPNLKYVLVLSDGLSVNGSQLCNGLNHGLAENVIISGGMAGDGRNFKSTWIIDHGKISPNCVLAVGFYGEHIRIGYGARGGWDIFGPERIITKASDNILYEIDGKPALELYNEYLGDTAADLPASGLRYPLSIKIKENPDTELVRTILAIDEANKALIFSGDVPEGAEAYLMKANFNKLIASAAEASHLALLAAKTDNNPSPPFILAISSVGRKFLLGERINEETETTLKTFPQGTQQVGFYSYGELVPHVNGKCELQNQVVSVTCIYEEE